MMTLLFGLDITTEVLKLTLTKLYLAPATSKLVSMIGLDPLYGYGVTLIRIEFCFD